MELNVLNISGGETGRKVKLSADVFGLEPNDHVMWLDVKQILANKRQGTHDTLEKSTISGSTRKLKRQKGTGGARAGSIKSGTRVGGARIFGPHPRDYHFKLNKKVKQLARKSALSAKAKDNTITVVEDFNFETPKTKQFLDILKGLKLEGTKFLLVTTDLNKNVFLSARNLTKSRILPASDINTYDILNAKNIIMTEGSVKKMEDLLSN